MTWRAMTTAGCALLAAACGGEGTAPVEEASGERDFRPCAVCHATAPAGTRAGDVKLVGPNLHGIVGDPAARVDDFDYSPAMRNAALVWDEPTLDAFIANPQTVIRGTRMSYFGEADPEVRKAIIEYLKTLE